MKGFKLIQIKESVYNDLKSLKDRTSFKSWSSFFNEWVQWTEETLKENKEVN